MNTKQRDKRKFSTKVSRLKKKVTRKFAKSVLKEIESEFNLTYSSVGSGYFIFDMGPSSVIHFKVTECPDWKFGIWFRGKDATMFGDNVYMIDKFKPSACPVSVTFPKSLIKEYTEALKRLISDTPEAYEAQSVIDRKNDELRALRVNYENLKTTKSIINILSDDKVWFKVHDRSSKYLSVSPRYEIQTYAESEIDEETLDKRVMNLYNSMTCQFQYAGYDTEDYVFEYCPDEMSPIVTPLEKDVYYMERELEWSVSCQPS
jgi:hypothetical protein